MPGTKIIITGTGSIVGQAVIKSLRASLLRGELELIGLDYIDETVGSFWVDKHYLLPDFFAKKATTNEWFERVVEIISKENAKVLFIGIDFELPLFARFRNDIESRTGCKVMVSDPRAIEIADDKYLTYRFLKENNYCCPETALAEEATGININFPCVLKPRRGAGSKDVSIINSRQELERKLIGNCGFMVQELIGNPDQEYTCGVIFLDGEVKNSIVLRRQLKKGDTISAYYEKTTPKSIYNHVHNVAMSLKPFGACNFQLRLDQDGRPKIFEINARHSGTTYIRSLFGFNEVEYILFHVLGLEINDSKLREGVVKRYYEEQFIAR